MNIVFTLNPKVICEANSAEGWLRIRRAPAGEPCFLNYAKRGSEYATHPSYRLFGISEEAISGETPLSLSHTTYNGKTVAVVELDTLSGAHAKYYLSPEADFFPVRLEKSRGGRLATYDMEIEKKNGVWVIKKLTDLKRDFGIPTNRVTIEYSNVKYLDPLQEKTEDFELCPQDYAEVYEFKRGEYARVK
jgi:hypothetical protein